jgi:hypothetical protein
MGLAGDGRSRRARSVFASENGTVRPDLKTKKWKTDGRRAPLRTAAICLHTCSNAPGHGWFRTPTGPISTVCPIASCPEIRDPSSASLAPGQPDLQVFHVPVRAEPGRCRRDLAQIAVQREQDVAGPNPGPVSRWGIRPLLRHDPDIRSSGDDVLVGVDVAEGVDEGPGFRPDLDRLFAGDGLAFPPIGHRRSLRRPLPRSWPPSRPGPPGRTRYARFRGRPRDG